MKNITKALIMAICSLGGVLGVVHDESYHVSSESSSSPSWLIQQVQSSFKYRMQLFTEYWNTRTTHGLKQALSDIKYDFGNFNHYYKYEQEVSNGTISRAALDEIWNYADSPEEFHNLVALIQKRELFVAQNMLEMHNLLRSPIMTRTSTGFILFGGYQYSIKELDQIVSDINRSKNKALYVANTAREFLEFQNEARSLNIGAVILYTGKLFDMPSVIDKSVNRPVDQEMIQKRSFIPRIDTKDLDSDLDLNPHHAPENKWSSNSYTSSPNVGDTSIFEVSEVSGLPTGTTIAVGPADCIANLSDLEDIPVDQGLHPISKEPSNDEFQPLPTNASCTSTTTEPNSFLQYTAPDSKTESTVPETSDDYGRMSIRTLTPATSFSDFGASTIEEYLDHNGERKYVHPEYSTDLPIGALYKYEAKIYDKYEAKIYEVTGPRQSIEVINTYITHEPRPTAPVQIISHTLDQTVTPEQVKGYMVDIYGRAYEKSQNKDVQRKVNQISDRINSRKHL